jgi:D-tyrosyl-tRNA(Tyr) deacylase
MRIVVQRVSKASVSIAGNLYSEINYGFLVLIGICDDDRYDDIEWLTQKIINLRVFGDELGKMNRSIQDINGEILIVSQFTLFASVKKGNRPSFVAYARPEIAIPMYEKFIDQLKKYDIKIQTGVFGANMQIELVNDGPVTIIIDSKNKE